MELVETISGILYIGNKDDALSIMDKTFDIKPDIIWNLAQELEFLGEQQKLYVKDQVLLACIPDYDIPQDISTFKHQLQIIINSLKKGKTIFIHCWGGHGRTGLALAIIKKILDNYPSEQALEYANDKCDGPETKEQKQFVCNFVF